MTAPTILKYAGSKRRLVPVLLGLYDRAVARMGSHDPIVIEPFAGSAAFSLSLAESTFEGDRDRPGMFAVDRNPIVFSILREISNEYGHRMIMNHMDQWSSMWTPEHYYRERKALNEDLANNRIPYASRCLFINRACFNGLMRMNRAGLFNVPWGNYSVPTADRLSSLKKIVRRQHAASAGVQIRHGCGLKSLGGALAQGAHSRAFVYADPPYLDTWNGYDGQPWLEADFIELLSLLNQYPFAVLSHADSPRARELIANHWPEARIVGHEARTSISCTVAGRGKRQDVLVLGPGFPASSLEMEIDER